VSGAERVNVAEAFAAIPEPWRPRVVARLNGQEVKLARLSGEFVWHRHEHEDEMFLVWRGTLRLEFRDRVLHLGAGDLAVVPRGTEHRPVAEGEAEVLLFEPAGVRNTGDVEHPTLTAPMEEGTS
jgi:mannose-6-phosphate isomerase-like protein (cupin superfamily)